jgi:hypothetical protein
LLRVQESFARFRVSGFVLEKVVERLNPFAKVGGGVETDVGDFLCRDFVHAQNEIISGTPWV